MIEEFAPCKYCATPTRMLGTKQCDACWEISKRVMTTDRDLLRKILDDVVKDRTPVQQIIDECDLIRAVLTGCQDSMAGRDALRANARVTAFVKSALGTNLGRTG